MVIRGDAQRELLSRYVRWLPDGCVVTFKEKTRSLDQNAKLWAMLGDISKQCGLKNQQFTPNQWKMIFMNACGWECLFLPAYGGGGMFPTGYQSSQLTVKQMAALITYIQAAGDEMCVEWGEQTLEYMQ
jgi:hypothetical protein